MVHYGFSYLLSANKTSKQIWIWFGVIHMGKDGNKIYYMQIAPYLQIWCHPSKTKIDLMKVNIIVITAGSGAQAMLGDGKTPLWWRRLSRSHPIIWCTYMPNADIVVMIIVMIIFCIVIIIIAMLPQMHDPCNFAALIE